ncbi:hypothetical protein [Paenibacillus aquistagni]|uniref:Uncharacterized protein n=1 Tax=Paenibacillus aquistagni TaxID=1852522 RepID=A0A1X7IW53_9BACL|nr:hypothetical protein [Paenibacillus aquistagni]SMG19152.1 hypothetical protein SAMN06295960_0878 [Paenibacillus aquistagni]
MRIFIACAVAYTLHLILSIWLDILTGFTLQEAWINQFSTLDVIDPGEMIVIILSFLILLASFSRKALQPLIQKFSALAQNKQQKSGQ